MAVVLAHQPPQLALERLERPDLDARSPDALQCLAIGAVPGSGREPWRDLLSYLQPGALDAEDVGALVNALVGAEALTRLLEAICTLDFEARKDAARAFGAFLRFGGDAAGAEAAIARHVRARPTVPEALVRGLGDVDVAPLFGFVVCACARYPAIATALLEAKMLEELLKLAGGGMPVEVSLEAFACLRELLLSQKEIAAAHLEVHFDTFFELYGELLRDGEYATQRQALRLLGDILVDSSFTNVMCSYVGNDQHLQTHMNLLRDGSLAIQLEEVRVFKLFVGNERMPPKVQLILFRNRQRLVRLLMSILSPQSSMALAHDIEVVSRVVAELDFPVARGPTAARLSVGRKNLKWNGH